MLAQCCHTRKKAAPKKRRVVVLSLLAIALVPTSSYAFSWASILKFFETMQNEMSAWSVQVKQTAVAANQISSSLMAANRQLATAIGAISMTERLGAALSSMSPALGQPISIKCEAQKQERLQQASWEQLALDRGHLMATYAGTRVSSKDGAEKERLATHREQYCTVSEARMGMCELNPNGMQGWDSNWAAIDGEMTLAPEAELAGYDFATTIADYRAPSAIDCKSASCSAAAMQQLAVASVGALVTDTFVGQTMARRVPTLTGK